MKQTTKSYLFIAAVFVAVTATISAFLPRERVINLDFEEGKPWKYEQLTSTFSFAVYKSERALQQERAEVMAALRPYYIMDTSKGILAIDKELWAAEADGIEEYYKKFGDRLPEELKAQLAALKANLA